MSPVAWAPQARWSRDFRIPQPPSLWQTQVNRYSVCYRSHICQVFTMQKMFGMCVKNKVWVRTLHDLFQSSLCFALLCPDHTYHPQFIHGGYWKGILKGKECNKSWRNPGSTNPSSFSEILERKPWKEKNRTAGFQDLPTQHSYQC